ncbi:hypothetical protein EBE87_20315 [Pseudoroseomonas wenyumeiae]|uniref:Uncharacterized protein n=2 Tax=Teichococcus wenyumeiae TaxID=2478470 RepID=A0A3A9JVJ3_9PROT|nr:hypothetical protein D6Z83_07590 [Pseudoroseomonas wenyumeiae]RMI19496.1 hypothetical protein EBE87_20315 [Pseudoroseomonas wenyumeiae]
MPNVAYPARLVEPPTLTRSIRILPEESARRTFQAGEVRLDNQDGLLDQVTGDWTMVGRPAILLRGPHREPFRAAYGEFDRMAELRITGAALSASGRVSIGLREAARDLAVPVTTPYAGTGGLEGDAGLKGQMRPMLYGAKRNLPAVTLLATQLVYQFSGRALSSITGVRDGGAVLAFAGNYASFPEMMTPSLPDSTYATCLAQGLIRLASPPARQVTADAVGAGAATHAGIALALLTGPGGLSGDRFDTASFTGTMPGGLAGFLFKGGTVEAALNEVTGSCASWWGSDRMGRIVAGRLFRPEAFPPDHALARWMLTGEPSEIEGTPPRWRQRVAYRVLGLVQSATDLTGVAAANPAAVSAYGTAQQIETAFDASVLASYPSATDPEPLVSGFDLAVDAQAEAAYLMSLHGVRRRRWRVPVGKWGAAINVGQSISVDHPRLAGRNWIVTGMDETGDAKTLTLWG